jgi:hypothetical protein
MRKSVELDIVGDRVRDVFSRLQPPVGVPPGGRCGEASPHSRCFPIYHRPRSFPNERRWCMDTESLCVYLLANGND